MVFLARERSNYKFKTRINNWSRTSSPSIFVHLNRYCNHYFITKVELFLVIKFINKCVMVKFEYILTIFNVYNSFYNFVPYPFLLPTFIVKFYYSFVNISFKHDIEVISIWPIGMYHLHLTFCKEFIGDIHKHSLKIISLYLCNASDNLLTLIDFHISYAKGAVTYSLYHFNYYITIFQIYLISKSRPVIQFKLNLYLQCPYSAIIIHVFKYCIIIYNG